jgi:hypothetical protein
MPVNTSFVTRVATLAAGAAVLYWWVIPVLHQTQAAVVQAISLIGGGR